MRGENSCAGAYPPRLPPAIVIGKAVPLRPSSRPASVLLLPAVTLLLASLVVALGGCRHLDREPPVELPPALRLTAGEPDRSLVEHYHRIDDRIASGGEPRGAEAFRALAALGVRTIVSVDGARPQVEAARAAGLRTVHLPIGYDGIPEGTVAALTRLAEETDGPIFVHCHHGKHRGPAAAAVLGLSIGVLDRAEGVAWLTRAGTGHDYSGLWSAVERFTPVDPSRAIPLVEVAEVTGLVDAMARIDRAKDHLRVLADHGWAVPPTHPDLVVAREIAAIREGFTESLRFVESDAPADLLEGLREAERQARALEAAESDGERAQKLAELLRGCRPCHAEYRD